MEANKNGRCSCGLHESEAVHEAAVEARLTAAVETAIVRAVLPEAESRRAFLAAIGLGTTLAAISEFFPLAEAAEVAQSTPGAIEKKQLKIGFIPITCATPIIMAEPLGFYRKHGLEVEVIKTAGWAVIRDKAINKEYDAAHMLSALAITLGAGAAPQPWTVPAIENINGQAITLSLKHKDKRDPKQWKGLKFTAILLIGAVGMALDQALARGGRLVSYAE
jgi:nitrate/nitrite transport system substrate-binding protein